MLPPGSACHRGALSAGARCGRTPNHLSRPGRAIGAGAALMLPLALALLSAAFPPQRPSLGHWGYFSSVTGIAVLAGPVVPGRLPRPGLAWIFWLHVPDRARS